MQKIILKLLAFFFLVGICINQTYGQTPIIANFTPSSGTVGNSVTISGTSFNANAVDNIVFFGATRGLVTADGNMRFFRYRK